MSCAGLFSFYSDYHPTLLVGHHYNIKLVLNCAMAPMKVIKNVMNMFRKHVLKKPAALNPKSLNSLGVATLDDKIGHYQKKGSNTIDSFLGSLSKEHRESLWQRFKYARQENKDLAKQYDQVATGAKCVGTKKDLLNIF